MRSLLVSLGIQFGVPVLIVLFLFIVAGFKRFRENSSRHALFMRPSKILWKW